MSPACIAQFFSLAMFFSTSALAMANVGTANARASSECQPTRSLTFMSVSFVMVLVAQGLLRLEWMRRRTLLGDDLRGSGLAAYRALDRLLHSRVVVVLDLLVVRGQPVNEHANADEQVVGLVLRDGPILDAIGHGHRHRAL